MRSVLIGVLCLLPSWVVAQVAAPSLDVHIEVARAEPPSLNGPGKRVLEGTVQLRAEQGRSLAWTHTTPQRFQRACAQTEPQSSLPFGVACDSTPQSLTLDIEVALASTDNLQPHYTITANGARAPGQDTLAPRVVTGSLDGGTNTIVLDELAGPSSYVVTIRVP